jgi:hypothetical protein
MRYLKDRSGFIYEWNPILAANADCVEVTEQEAFPEKFIPKKQANRKTALALETEEIPQEPEPTNDELNQEASKGL